MKDFNRLYSGSWDSKETVAAYERAFKARLEYEKNCMAKYDYPKWTGRPSKTPIKGERIHDFAIRYNTTVKEMKCSSLLDAVERQLIKEGFKID